MIQPSVLCERMSFLAVKKTPLRQCLGCRTMLPKRELIRIVRSPEGEISLDPAGKKPGRGAYVCQAADCLKKAHKGKALQKAFGAAVPEDVFSGLLARMEAADG